MWKQIKLLVITSIGRQLIKNKINSHVYTYHHHRTHTRKQDYNTCYKQQMLEVISDDLMA